MVLSEAKSRCLLSGESVNGQEGVQKEDLPALSPRSLSQEFPQHAPALFDLIHNTEHTMQTGYEGPIPLKAQPPLRPFQEEAAAEP